MFADHFTLPAAASWTDIFLIHVGHCGHPLPGLHCPLPAAVRAAPTASSLVMCPVYVCYTVCLGQLVSLVTEYQTPPWAFAIRVWTSAVLTGCSG